MASEQEGAASDYNLFRLYNRVFEDHFKECGYSDKKIEEEILRIIKAFKYAEGGRFLDVDLTCEDLRLGYIYRYASHGAGLAQYKILQALENCEELRSILIKPQLNVVSLGGGPGNDAIGFCSAMSRSQFIGEVRMHVVDKIPDWEKYIKKAQTLLEQEDFGDESRLFKQRRVRLDFTSCVLPWEMHSLSIGECDVVLMCKLVSIMSFEEIRNLIRNLYLTMNESAVILLVDSPFLTDWEDKFEVLYLSDEDEYYHTPTIQKRFEFKTCKGSKARIAVLRKKKSNILEKEEKKSGDGDTKEKI